MIQTSDDRFSFLANKVAGSMGSCCMLIGKMTRHSALCNSRNRADGPCVDRPTCGAIHENLKTLLQQNVQQAKNCSNPPTLTAKQNAARKHEQDAPPQPRG